MTLTLQTIVPRLIAALLGESEDDKYNRQYAADLVTEFNDDTSKQGVWTGLEKAAFCARLGELVRNPHELNQGGTAFCTPAAVLYLLARHYPRRFADFGLKLFETGETRIGSREIEMESGIRETDLTAWVTSTNWGINATDMLLILAVQEDMTFLDIDGPDDYALLPPFFDSAYASDVHSTLGDSGLFDVEDLDATAAAIKAADLPDRTHIILVGSMTIFSKKQGGGAWGSDGRHAAVLVPPLTIEGSKVTFRFWSWGTFENENTFPVQGGEFREHTASESSFNSKVDTAIRITATADDI